MTKVLFIAATPAEIAPVSLAFGDRYTYFVCGMGSTATAIGTLHSIERHRPQLVVLLGIAGAVDRSLSIGQVVSVASDYHADHGAWREEENRFIAFDQPIYRSDFTIDGHLAVAARTVATACTPLMAGGSQIETMEGAAFFAAAQAAACPAAQIRSISNYVGDIRSEWKIAEAIESLKNVIIKIF